MKIERPGRGGPRMKRLAAIVTAPFLMAAALLLAPAVVSPAAAEPTPLIKLAQQSDNPFSALVGKRRDRAGDCSGSTAFSMRQGRRLRFIC